ncbi:MAG: iron ABC transporter permease, partial [Spirochaetales bacterium]|nr:iron ABC transporter permease [Spirochaetales bacterium]
MKILKFSLLALTLVLSILGSIAYGEIKVPPGEVLPALFGRSSDYYNSLIANIRVPRVISGALIGAALSVSGLLTSTALRNPLADSGILGIQSGATVGALTALLLFPSMTPFLPLFAFAGGMAAFGILLLLSFGRRGYEPNRIVLIGVAVNSMGTSLIGIITLMNVYKIRDAISWLSGSLVSITGSQMRIITVYTLLFLLLAFLLIPVLKLLLLEDGAVIGLGHNPTLLRIIVSLCAVFLAGVGVAYAGVISFIGIIAPQLARRITGHGMETLLPSSLLIGGTLVVLTDFLQRVIFSPMEIPVGILIGILGAPLFIALASGGK